MKITPESLNIKNNTLHLGEFDLTELALTHRTPLYILDIPTIEKNSREFTDTLKKTYPNHLVAYAGKANLTMGIAKLMHRLGLGIDVVSYGELFTVLQAGIPTDQILFHGNNKSREELELAIDNHVQIIVDNSQEIDNIIHITTDKKTNASILLRIKPSIDTQTHRHIQTGQDDSKFGIHLSELDGILDKIATCPNIQFKGLHAHIGSQISDPAPYLKLVQKMTDLIKHLHQTRQLVIETLNLGGGFGILYTEKDKALNVPDLLTQMTAQLTQTLTAEKLPLPKLIIEPGRYIIGNAGITIYSIGTIKTIPNSPIQYAFIDGGMADNPRPIMYQSKYTMAIANNPTGPATHTYHIAGRFCESGDKLQESVMLPKIKTGDILVVYGTGAYNYAMASHYNRMPIPPMIAINTNKIITLLKPETYKDLIQFDINTSI